MGLTRKIDSEMVNVPSKKIKLGSYVPLELRIDREDNFSIILGGVPISKTLSNPSFELTEENVRDQYKRIMDLIKKGNYEIRYKDLIPISIAVFG